MRIKGLIGGIALLATVCSCGKSTEAKAETAIDGSEEAVMEISFDADSAYRYVERMVSFGPRVPNTEAHRRGGDWLVGKLHEFGLTPIEQKATLTAFDGTALQMRNIFAQINPQAEERTLLLAHWDCRPWADADPDPGKRSQPVDGANDGASGVGVILEIARQLAADKPATGVDILFADAEDWGEESNDESWAMGTRYFAEHPIIDGYAPTEAILLDMVGSPDARFGYEYNSFQAARPLLQAIWSKAAALGYNQFHTGFGGAVTDDHVELIKKGIPTVDIIDYRSDSPYGGFDPVWHTANDGMQNISRKTLEAVGKTLMAYIKQK